ncbi:cation:proton antiporter [Phycisphaerales bacterium AB-hyl4]|uniref:Cation:proton antiporter n=1 Tax=Natronomicrosphaera hydrolytica TaxID=3242702 RepID=A0ABV4UBA2_9BACT
MIVTAAALVLVARLVRMPSIVAYIFAGLVLGPMLGVLVFEVHTPGDHDAPATMEVLTELGIALLLFLVGLELSLDKIRDVGKVAVLAGIGQVVFTAAGGFVLSLVLQFSVMESMFLATALTFSSTVVVVKLLDQKKELHSLYGRIAVGIFLVQDLVVIIALTFLAGLGTEADGEEASRSIGAMTGNLALAFVGMGVLLVAALLASKFLLPRPFGWLGPSPQAMVIAALTWCFAFVVAAEWMGLSLEIGAFLAGLSLAQLDVAHDLRRRVHPLMNFFIAIFFISLGAQMDLSGAINDWFAATILSLFVLIGNPFIFMWIIARCGYSERTSFLTSVTVAQISEFSFIFAAMGMAAGLIDDRVLSIVMVVGLVTIAISSYMILYNHPLFAVCHRFGLLRMFGAGEQEDADNAEPPLCGHVIVVGMNAMGRRLASELHRRGETVLAIDTDARKLAGLPCKTMVGHIDYLSVLEEAGLPEAKLAITALQIEDTNNLFVYRCRQFGVPVAAHAFDRSVRGDLLRLGTDFLIDAKAESSRQLDERLRDAGVA